MTTNKTLEKKLDNLLNALDTQFIKALAEPARLEIIKHLIVERSCDVSTLAEKMPQDQSVISRHLSVLHTAGILECRKEGRHKYYNLNPDATLSSAKSILDTIEQCIELGCC